MLLRDKLLKVGDTLFKYRGYQFVLYFGVAALSWENFAQTKDSYYFELICVFVAFCGMLVRALTVGFVKDGTSGRNTNEQVADELNTDGIYSVVRNPLYIGNFLIFLGVILLTQDVKTIILVSSLYWLFYTPIILTEENFLLGKFGEEYTKYSETVPCLIPSFKNFKKSGRKFSFTMVLFREQDTLLTTVLLFFAAEAIMETAQLGEFKMDLSWKIVTVLILCFYAVLKILKKKK